MGGHFGLVRYTVMAIMASTIPGGSTSTDIQPPTRNPQGNVGGGLQPNSAFLQPITSSSSSNAFNQPGVNPQAFPKTSSLQVESTGTTLQASWQKSDSTSNSRGISAMTLFFVAIAVVLAVLILILKFAKPADKLEQEKTEEPKLVVAPEPSKSQPKKKPKKKKPKKKKINTKKRK